MNGTNKLTAKDILPQLSLEEQFRFLVEEERREREKESRVKNEELIGDIFTFAVVAGCALAIGVPSLNQTCDRLIATIFKLPQSSTVATSGNPKISNRKAYPGDKIGVYTVGSDFKPCIIGGKVDCRWHPINGGWSAHKALDIGGNIGDPLYPVGMPGSKTKIECKVEKNDKGELIGAGNYAILTNPSIPNTQFLAMHLFACYPGTKNLGEVYGKLGHTGASTAPHLHWQQEQLNTGKRVAVRPDFDWLHQTLTGKLPVTNKANKRKAIATAALSRVGTEFNPGLQAQCAYFVRDVLKSAGISVPVTRQPIDATRTGGEGLAASLAGSDIGQIIKREADLQPGDIVFWANTYGNWPSGTITHTGIYVGKGEIVDRGTASAPIKKCSAKTFKNFVAGVRIYDKYL